MDKLTPTMLRELRSIATHGQPTDGLDIGGPAHLVFWARDKAIGGLMARGLIDDAEHVTEAGLAALKSEAAQ